MPSITTTTTWARSWWPSARRRRSSILRRGLHRAHLRAHRYDSNVLNSFGHPVPRVAGKLQREGRAAEAKVRRADFTDAMDTLVFDIRSCYEVPELKKLDRTFVYSREGNGRFWSATRSS